MVLILISTLAFGSGSDDVSPNPKSPTEEQEVGLAQLAREDHYASRHSLAHYRIEADPLSATLLPYRNSMPTFPTHIIAPSTNSVAVAIVIQLPSFDSLPDDIGTDIPSKDVPSNDLPSSK